MVTRFMGGLRDLWEFTRFMGGFTRFMGVCEIYGSYEIYGAYNWRYTELERHFPLCIFSGFHSNFVIEVGCWSFKFKHNTVSIGFIKSSSKTKL